MSLRSITTGVPDSTSWMKSKIVDPRSKEILLKGNQPPWDPTRILVIGTNSEDHANVLVRAINKNNKGLTVHAVGQLRLIFKFYFNQIDERPGQEPSIPLLVFVGNSIRARVSGEPQCYGIDQTFLGENHSSLQLISSLCSRYGTQIRRFGPKDSYAEIANEILNR